MHVVRTGEGPLRVLILPSNGMFAAYYTPLARRLADRGCTVTAVTLPGFDGVPALQQPSWDGLIDACEPLVRELGDGVLVGHSLGGMLAVQLAGRHPVRRLVLMEPAITPVEALAGFFARKYRQEAIDGWTGFRNDGPGFRRLHDPDAFPPDAMAGVLRCVEGTDRATLVALAEGFASVRVPWKRVQAETVLVRGGSSGWLMHAAQIALSWRLGARRACVPDAGHWMANEQDDALARIIAG